MRFSFLIIFVISTSISIVMIIVIAPSRHTKSIILVIIIGFFSSMGCGALIHSTAMPIVVDIVIGSSTSGWPSPAARSRRTAATISS